MLWPIGQDHVLRSRPCTDCNPNRARKNERSIVNIFWQRSEVGVVCLESVCLPTELFREPEASLHLSLVTYSVSCFLCFLFKFWIEIVLVPGGESSSKKGFMKFIPIRILFVSVLIHMNKNTTATSRRIDIWVKITIGQSNFPGLINNSRSLALVLAPLGPVSCLEGCGLPGRGSPVWKRWYSSWYKVTLPWLPWKHLIWWYTFSCGRWRPSRSTLAVGTLTSRRRRTQGPCSCWCAWCRRGSPSCRWEQGWWCWCRSHACHGRNVQCWSRGETGVASDTLFRVPERRIHSPPTARRCLPHF